MKPSERIKELCKKLCAERGKHQPNNKDIDEALPYAIVKYLDEEHEAKPDGSKPPLGPR